MALITAQKDLDVSHKRETLMNLRILNKRQPMPTGLSTQLFEDNALKKPTQNVFNHLAYYLVAIIDPVVSAALPWPLHDTKVERAFRNDLSSFIADYSNKGLLSRVMSSYLVNPGCYKVTLLIFQMSQLAVKMELFNAPLKDNQRKLYTDVTEMYMTKDKAFKDKVKNETKSIVGKFAHYIHKRKETEKVAVILKTKITQMLDALKESKAQETIDNLVYGLLKQNYIDCDLKSDIIKLKNVHEKPMFIEHWLTALDDQVNDMEKMWDEKMAPFISICQKTVSNIKTLVARHLGQADRETFDVEYNSKTDEIDTEELQTLVNSQQKHILKNIIKGDILDFPNLIRGFLISVCYIMKDTKVANMDGFNEFLNGALKNHKEMIEEMKSLLERVKKVESKLSPPKKYKVPKEYFEIPPHPDLSKITLNKRDPPNLSYDLAPLSPMNFPICKFNLYPRMDNTGLANPIPKMPSSITPFHNSTQRDEIFKPTSHVDFYDQSTLLNLHNISPILNKSRFNETTPKNSDGFTQEQISELLHTNGSKMLKHKIMRQSKHIVYSPDLISVKEIGSMAKNEAQKLSIMKEGSPTLLESSGIATLHRERNKYGFTEEQITRLLYTKSSKTPTMGPSKQKDDIDELFNESTLFNDTLSSSQSSPDLLNVEEIGSMAKNKARKLSTMKEGSPTLLELSGIATLDRDKKNSTPQCVISLTQITSKSPIENTQIESKSTDLQRNETDTPRNKSDLFQKTSSIEKSIDQFKKIKANTSIVPGNIPANRVLSPDLLRPSCSTVNEQLVDQYLLGFESEEEEETTPGKRRESLGTMLGVDITILDDLSYFSD